jgi:hypothetical protein
MKWKWLFMNGGVFKLAPRWNECIIVPGVYVEKKIILTWKK